MRPIAVDASASISGEPTGCLSIDDSSDNGVPEFIANDCSCKEIVVAATFAQPVHVDMSCLIARKRVASSIDVQRSETQFVLQFIAGCERWLIHRHLLWQR